MPHPKVAVAMSGGVDSSVCAALLKDAGHEVVGLAMRLRGDSGHMDDARRVCESLKIPFLALDFEKPFRDLVLDYFCQEYARGRTPNPCVVCNQNIKFGLLLTTALSLGARFLATGHYARVDRSGGVHRLLKGIDAGSDQSYFLYTLNQQQLRNIMFPLGVYTKAQVRRMAADRGLHVAEKRKSRDLCFVADGKWQDYVREHAILTPGPVLDTGGRQIGSHQGLAMYTVGQRTGLGIAAGRRLFVLAIHVDSNTLVVGPEEELLAGGLRAGTVSFVAESPQQPVAVAAKVRYRAPMAGAILYPHGSDTEVEFDVPQRAIAPGQAVVFYRGDEVTGGGIIEASWTGRRPSMARTN